MTKTENIAVVCASGGMDSAVCAALACRDSGRVYFLHADYGQLTETAERERFGRLAAHFGAAGKLLIRLDHLREIGGSSLTDRAIDVPEADLANPSIPSTYVPFRNAQIMSAAVAWAEVLGAGAVYIGAVEQDSSGYPDCRRSFFEAFERAVDLGTRPGTRIDIRTPLIGMKKSEIVRLGLSLGVPFELTWSCYRSEGTACGRCDSCALRLRAFREAGVEDPIPYEKV